METLFVTLVNMSITASWLVLAVIGVRLVFRKTPKWVLCLLWGLVALRLIFPFSLESALSLIPSTQTLPQEIVYTAQPEIHSGIEAVDSVVNPVLEENMAVPEPAVTSANPTQIWSFLLSVTWAAGCGCMLLYALISYLLLKHRVAAAIPLEKGIKQSELVDSPFVLGLFRPVIYLPISISPKDLPYVISHEQSHIHRGDHWWKPVGFVLLSVYWFNPVLWLAYILLCRDIEAACDERVIRDMGMEDRRAYSTALLNCSIRRKSIAACPLAFGEVGVKERIKSVMHYKKPGFWILLAALVVTIVVAVCFLTNPVVSQQQVQWLDLEKEMEQSLQLRSSDLTHYTDGVASGTTRTEYYYGNNGQRIYAIVYDDGEIESKTITEQDAYGNELSSTTYLPDGITQNFEREYRHTLDWRHRPVHTEFYDNGILRDTQDKSYDWRGNVVREITQFFDQEGNVTAVNRITRKYNWRGELTLEEETYDSGEVTTKTVTTYEKGLAYETAEYAEDGTLLSKERYIYYYNEEGNPQAKVIQDADTGITTCRHFYAYQKDGYTVTIEQETETTGEKIRRNSVVFCDYEGNLLRRFWQENGEVFLDMQNQYEPKGQTVDDEVFLPQFQQSKEVPMPEEISCMDIWYEHRGICLSEREEVSKLYTILKEAQSQTSPVPESSVPKKNQDDYSLQYIAVNYSDGTKTVYRLSKDCSLIWEDAPEGERTIYSLARWDWLSNYLEQQTDGVQNEETSGQPFASKTQPWNWTKNVTAEAIEEASVYLVLKTYQTENGGGGQTVRFGFLRSVYLPELLEVLHQIPESAFTPGEDMSRWWYSRLYTSLSDTGSAIYIRDPVNSMGVVIRNTEDGVGIALCDDVERVEDGDTFLLDSVQYWNVEDSALRAYMNSLLEKSQEVAFAVGGEYSWQDAQEFAYGDFAMTLQLIEGWEYEVVDGTPQSTNFGIRCRPGDVSEGWIYFSFWPEGYHPQESDRFYSERGKNGYSGRVSYPSSVESSGGLDLRDGIWSYEVINMDTGDFAVINQGADSWFLEYKNAIEDTVSLCQIKGIE